MLLILTACGNEKPGAETQQSENDQIIRLSEAQLKTAGIAEHAEVAKEIGWKIKVQNLCGWHTVPVLPKDEAWEQRGMIDRNPPTTLPLGSTITIRKSWATRALSRVY